MDRRQPTLVPRHLGVLQEILHPVIPLIHAQPLSNREQGRPRGGALEHVVQIVHTYRSVFAVIARKRD